MKDIIIPNYTGSEYNLLTATPVDIYTLREFDTEAEILKYISDNKLEVENEIT